MIARREFISLLGGAAAAWPVVARGQQPTMPVVGIVTAQFPSEVEAVLAAFRQGLNDTGFFEGRNVSVEYRSAEFQYGRLPTLMADLVQGQVAVIVAIGSTVIAQAAIKATSTIPIVFAVGSDPVNVGLVASLNRPGANVTGVSFLVNTLGAKRIELLRELVPTATGIGLLVNPTNINSEPEVRDLQGAAQTLGLNIHAVTASRERDIESAFSSFVGKKVGAVVVIADSFFLSRRDQLVALAARYRLPAMYHVREFAVVGGLMSYGTSLLDAHRQAGVYAGRILKGEKPAELPVQQSVKVELVINLKTAKTLGLTVPITLLGRADEVIE